MAPRVPKPGGALPPTPPLSLPGPLIPTSASRSRSALVSAKLLGASGSSQLPTETYWSLIIAPWCRTSGELEQLRLAGRGHHWLPPLAWALACSTGRKKHLSREPPPCPAPLQPGSQLRSPLQPPAAADGQLATLQGSPAKSSVAYTAPQNPPHANAGGTGLHACGSIRPSWRSHRGRRTGSTHPTTLLAWHWCEHP